MMTRRDFFTRAATALGAVAVGSSIPNAEDRRSSCFRAILIKAQVGSLSSSGGFIDIMPLCEPRYLELEAP